MAQVELTSTSLIVHIRGADRFFAMQSRLEVPLEHIASVEPAADEARQVWHGLRMGGTNVPGVITAGRFVEQGEWAFWDVHDPRSAIAIHLRDESYAKLVIGVDDPEVACEAIRSGCGPSLTRREATWEHPPRRSPRHAVARGAAAVMRKRA